jgi:hypothetical protein
VATYLCTTIARWWCGRALQTMKAKGRLVVCCVDVLRSTCVMWGLNKDEGMRDRKMSGSKERR